MASVLTVELDDTSDSTLQALAASWHLDSREAIKKAVSVAASTLPAKHISSPLKAWK
jgi:predicted transcriptional regulator